MCYYNNVKDDQFRYKFAEIAIIVDFREIIRRPDIEKTAQSAS